MPASFRRYQKALPPGVVRRMILSLFDVRTFNVPKVYGSVGLLDETVRRAASFRLSLPLQSTLLEHPVIFPNLYKSFSVLEL